MKDTEFLEKLRFAATQPSIYLWGTFGMRLTENLIQQKMAQYPNRYSPQRVDYLRTQIPNQPWAWDCAGLIKGILWGWEGNPDLSYGGGQYESNGVPDLNVSGLERNCYDLSEDFSTLRLGELLFYPGHVGVYAGDGTVIEATLDYERDGVVISDLARRNWTRHGKLNFIEYGEEETERKTFLHVEKIGLYLRDSLTFNRRNKASGKTLAFCPVGKEMEVLELIPGLQPDGYQWLRTRYDGVEGYSQLDSQCYYLFQA